MTTAPGRLRTVVALASAAVAAVLPPTGSPSSASAGDGPSLEAYRGLGTWVDMFDAGPWTHPREAVRKMAARGVRTLYIQTANYHTPARRKIYHKADQARFIEAAHELGMRVVAWFLPSFSRLARDRRRSLAAIRFRTPSGERFDSFALDIESSIVDSPWRRTRRLLRLSRWIRNTAGNNYPLGAIVASPRRVQTDPYYWPSFPYRRLADRYDVFLPMTYYSARTQGERGAHEYTARNIKIIRRETGRGAIPIHPIGGLAAQSDVRETRGYVHAVRAHGSIGGSFYDFPTTGDGDWGQLSKIPVNPQQRPPLPVPFGLDQALGNIPEVDWTHPKEVFFRTGGVRGPRILRFEAFDAQAQEIRILVNWNPLGYVAPTLVDSWGLPQEIPIPDRFLREGRANFVGFVALGAYPEWHRWGVQEVQLLTP